MKKQLHSTVAIPALALAALIAIPSGASADVIIDAQISKEKHLFVQEFIFKTKFVFIDVFADFDIDSAAEAMAVVNAANEDNIVIGYDGTGILAGNDIRRDPFADFNINLSAEVVNSINNNQGVAGVNVDVGNMVNQGNVVSFSLVGPDILDEDSFGSLAHTQAEIEQRNLRNETFDSEFLDPDGQGGFIPNKTAVVVDSVNGNSGIVGVNVNSGNTSNQHNVVAMSVGFDALVALSEAALGQFNSGNTVTEIETIKVALISGSVNGNSGVVSLNVNNGNHNNQASVVSFSALTSNAVVGVPGS